MRVQLLGDGGVFDGQRWHYPPLDKRFCLLAYLACAGNWVPRERLSFLFWPDAPDEQARTNLRQLLSRVKGLPFAEGLEAEPARLRWIVASDVKAFQDALRRADWLEAVALYNGALLAGLTVNKGSEFDAWVELERESLRVGWRRAVVARAEGFMQAARHAEAAELLERLLRDDELDESVLQGFLESAARAGQRTLVLERYARFVKKLASELGLEPLPATQAFVETLKSRAQSAPERSSSLSPRLPAWGTPFVGRDLELTDLLNALHRPECRLLMLIGPGGIGKTRLASRVAEELVTSYRDGGVFVSLAAVADAELVVAAIAGALSFSFSGHGDASAELLGYLQGKRLLVVLDNLEHLLAATPFVAELLTTCPGITLLATSRERLNLTGEWLYPVGGMSLPQDDTQTSTQQNSTQNDAASPFEGFDAVRLFLVCARRSKPDFILAPGDRRPLVQLCRLVGGAPLGIELAAGWAALLSVPEIASEIEKSTDFLESALRNLPERHRSLRTVFEWSWRLLAEPERSALSRLSVFRGGFTREAVGAVTFAPLRALLSLLEKSLLKRDPDGRFELHELVRAYAAEKLEQTPEAEQEVRSRHSAFYTAFVQARETQLRGGSGQREALGELGTELANIRAAWGFAARKKDVRALGDAVALGHFFEVRGLYAEGETLFAEAVLSLEGLSLEVSGVSLSKLLTWQAALLGRLGQLEASHAAAKRSLAIYERLGETDGLGFTLLHLGVLQHYQSDLVGAEAWYRRALKVAGQTGDAWSRGGALGNLGAAAAERGEHQEAERRFRESLALARERGDRWMLSICLVEFAQSLGAQHRFKEAQGALEEALAVAREIGQTPMIVAALSGLGDLALKQGVTQKAEAYGLEALKEARELGSRAEYARILALLGTVTASGARYREALGYFSAALRHAVAGSAPPYAQALSYAVYTAEVLFHSGDTTRALELLAFATLHELSQEERQKVASVGSALERHLPAATRRAAQVKAHQLDFGDLPALLDEYAVYD